MMTMRRRRRNKKPAVHVMAMNSIAKPRYGFHYSM
jgi:hypothetical protein